MGEAFVCGEGAFWIASDHLPPSKFMCSASVVGFHMRESCDRWPPSVPASVLAGGPHHG